MKLTIAKLDKMDINDLHDDDLVIVWDTSENKRRTQLEDMYGATRNLPSSTKSLRVGDLFHLLFDRVKVGLEKDARR